MKIGRNDPCPCGSGAKVKRCCGVEGVRRSHEAFADLVTLAFHFPRQRPASATFDDWARHTGDQLTRGSLEAGFAQLGPGEEARIPAEFAAAYPEVWEAIVAESGDRREAIETLLVGAVVAGLEERQRELDPEALEILELDAEARQDPVESLALVLVAGDLWSVLEAEEALVSFNRGTHISAVAEQLWSEWHEQRLAELVRRLGERLPVPNHPRASAALEAACGAFERDDRAGRRLRAELLLDALPGAFDALGLAA
jgi:SEC-C motif